MGVVRSGVNPILEAEANRILRDSMAGITKHSAKADILTPWKEQDRRRREVYVPSGTPDAANRQGMYHRRANPTKPHLNARDARVAPSRPNGMFGSLSAFVEENGLGGSFVEEIG